LDWIASKRFNVEDGAYERDIEGDWNFTVMAVRRVREDFEDIVVRRQLALVALICGVPKFPIGKSFRE